MLRLTLTVTNIQFSDGTNYTVVATNISGAITGPVAAVIIWPNSSARLLSPQLLTNGFTLTVAGLTNRPYRIESTTHLNSPAVWVSVFTNFVTYSFTNLAITNDTKRFYRAITNN